MDHIIKAAERASEWRSGIAVLHRVYVGEGHSSPERAALFCDREALQAAGTFLVAATIDGAVHGAILLTHIHSPMNQLSRPGERELRLLAVLDEARGQGIAKALVSACMERSKAEGAQGIVLWTRPVMTAAQRLYEQLGFVRDPERDMPDPSGFMRLVYRMDLI